MLNGIEIIVRAYGVTESKRKAYYIRKEAKRLIALSDEWKAPYLYAAKYEGAKELWLQLDKVYDWVQDSSWIPEPHQPRYLKQFLDSKASWGSHRYVIDYCKELKTHPLKLNRWLEWKGEYAVHREDS